MSEPEKALQNFLQRWSRRKLAVAEQDQDGSKAQPEKADGAETEVQADTQPPDAIAAFDAASLPPLESITQASDIRAFLAPGVPAELTRAALRRAWVSDPAIRDFIGLAENQWDFTKPESIPGFGSLELNPELGRMIANVFGEAPADPEPPSDPDQAQISEITDSSSETPSSTPAAIPDLTLPAASAVATSPAPMTNDENAATQHDCAGNEFGPRRGQHGGALPK